MISLTIRAEAMEGLTSAERAEVDQCLASMSGAINAEMNERLFNVYAYGTSHPEEGSLCMESTPGQGNAWLKNLWCASRQAGKSRTMQALREARQTPQVGEEQGSNMEADSLAETGLTVAKLREARRLLAEGVDEAMRRRAANLDAELLAAAQDVSLDDDATIQCPRIDGYVSFRVGDIRAAIEATRIQFEPGTWNSPLLELWPSCDDPSCLLCVRPQESLRPEIDYTQELADVPTIDEMWAKMAELGILRDEE